MTRDQVNPFGPSHPPSELRDPDGRVIKVRQLTALDTLRLFKLAGPVLAQNEPWLALATLAYAVTEIDGVPVPVPATEAQVEALVERLGERSLTLIGDHLDTLADGSLDTIAASAGNSPGTPL